ncbi:MAG: hypothetical protein Q4F61_01530 [Candidatus Saccharibacteria bacterium]|nr:hypothetical protein [Candidatus Saccharibacteria bacterium]
MELKNWAVYPDPRNKAVARACIDEFARLTLGDSTYHSFEALNESCRISGSVYGHKKYADGTEIGTSRVKSASRLEGNVLEITTQSGSRYLLKIDQMNREMEQTLLEARRQQLYAVAGRTGYEESCT